MPQSLHKAHEGIRNDLIIAERAVEDISEFWVECILISGEDEFE